MLQTAIGTQRAVGYFRVSGPKQAGERHFSLPTQEARFREYCQTKDLTPVATYTDTLTGRRDDRQGYRQMVDFLLQGGADVVVVQFLDRFGRNPREILRRYWELEERGVAVVATDEDIKEELQLLIRAYMAGSESRRTSERVRAYMPKAIAGGSHAGRAPYGLRGVKVIGEDGKPRTVFELNPEEVKVAREMYRLAVEENLGFKAIGDRLTEKGYRARGGGLFLAQTIHHLLSNPALKGTMIYGREPRKGNPKIELVIIDGYFPPILSGEEWARLQERQAIRRQTPKGKTHSSTYLLSGIAKCGYCGGSMVGRVGARRGEQQYKNYACSRSIASKGLCSHCNSHSVPKLEKAILEYLGQFVDPEKVKEYLSLEDAKQLGRYQKELAQAEKQLTEMDNAFLKDLDRLDRGVLNEAEFTKSNQARRGDKERLEAQRIEAKARMEAEGGKVAQAERVPVAVRSFLEDFTGQDVRRQKGQLQLILKAAFVWRDKIELEFRG